MNCNDTENLKQTTVDKNQPVRRVLMRMVYLIFMFGIVSTPALSSDSNHDSGQHSVTVSKHKGSPHWSYTGSEGPSHWGDLSGDYDVCKTGKNQSPIDIQGSVISEVFDLKFDYRSVPLQILNNGHTIQFNYSDISQDSSHYVSVDGKQFPLPSAISHNSALHISGEQYNLIQVHFHSPSEHAVNGVRYPLEAHFVHMNKQKQLAVVGVMFRQGKDNRFISGIWQHMPRLPQPASMINGVNINVSALLPKSSKYYHYRGSLTTPPCSEGVRWFVMKESLEVSEEQVQQFLSVVHENARPLQPINHRYLVTTK